MASLSDRLVHAWNAFLGNDRYRSAFRDYGYSYYYRPDRPRLTRGNDRTIVTAIYNRIAIDVSAISIRHVRTDQNGRFVEDIHSGLNNCLTLEANQDQTGRAFIQDLVMSMFDEGCVAVVPVDASVNIASGTTFDILTLRTGKITQWYPAHVKVELYNEKLGKKEELILPKKSVGIIENPLYAVMNEPNSILQRLVRKLSILDSIDEQSGAGKLDLIIQLPYVIKSDSRRAQAEMRRKDIEMQLANTKYGVAYTDATEKIVQLNRPVENNLMTQIEYLTSMLYGQLGMTEEVLNGTADEKVMLNYYNRTIEPILSSIAVEFKRKFISKTARTQGQDILYFREPFKLVTVNELAESADKLTRNEILSTNEVRSIIGLKPSDDPRADELVNKNISSQAGASDMPVDLQMDPEVDVGEQVVPIEQQKLEQG